MFAVSPSAGPGRLRDDLPTALEEEEASAENDAPPPYQQEDGLPGVGGAFGGGASGGFGGEYMELGLVKPLWMPDSEADYCLQCAAPFTMLRRRHHCRCCGRIFCGKCTQFKAPLQHMDFKIARVCQQCNDSIAQGECAVGVLWRGG